MLETREGGCHCGAARFRVTVDLDNLSHCGCSVCVKKGAMHLVTDPPNFQPPRGGAALTKRFFDGRTWEAARQRRLAEGGHATNPGVRGAETLRAILARAGEPP
jgi:hypothetical protein